ncbi:hypothetical protein [Halovalidus salilacus]|uniref:hypothetical protein n=1 Tax=Halovalidus salilacus TaxID=3075124 RepID=UPI0036215764
MGGPVGFRRSSPAVRCPTADQSSSSTFTSPPTIDYREPSADDRSLATDGRPVSGGQSVRRPTIRPPSTVDTDDDPTVE